ncbi:homocysteine S-methyltransferase family protein [Thermoproteota archaeon]
MENNKLKNLLKNKVIVLDGAIGTELQKRGMPTGACPEIWSIQNPDVVKAVHLDYMKSGSRIIYTCSFGANRCKLAQYDRQDVGAINKKLARLARSATNKDVLIAGDIGPTGKFVKPFGSLEFQEAVDIFKEQARGLLEGGVDLFVIETMMDIQEARAALIAVKEVSKLFTIVTMTFEEDERTLNGTDPVTALITLQSLGADAVGCNCSSGPRDMIKLISQMKPFATVPLVAKPNAGTPKLVDGKTVFDMCAKTFASLTKKLIREGVGLVGGCCGTTPQHVGELSKQIKDLKPIAPLRSSISAISSARKTVLINKQKTPIIIGERINPTGKKLFQQELREGKFSYVRSVAKEQQVNGAQILDVNVGMPHIDEVSAMINNINILSNTSDLPLVIDSSRVEVIEAALRIYPGRALVNSISGEKKKIAKLLPIAKKYGAMIIILPITGKSIAKVARDRIKIIKDLIKKVGKSGFTKDDIIIDALTLAVSSIPQAGIETLKTISICYHELRCKTVIGLSNISFGLPERRLLNATFLSLASAKGLTLAIADPLACKDRFNKGAQRVLLGKDKDAADYIKHSKKFSASAKDPAIEINYTPEQKISHAILEGNREEIVALIKDSLKQNQSASHLVNGVMIPAITKVGDLFDMKEYFLPQLIASAETMKKGFSYLEPYLKGHKDYIHKKIIVLLATVEGDIHDIGKNIVSLMLKNHGFDVVDLGKDVSTKKIIDCIRHHRPAIVGLSALMTTTMVNMKEVVDTAKQEGLNPKFIVGGAVVTKAYAESIGVKYAKDGVAAVRLAKHISS